MERKKITEEQNKKLEIICVLVLIVFAVLSYIFTKYIKNDKTSYNYISIYIEDTEVKTLSLSDISDQNIIVYQINDEIYAVNFENENDMQDIMEKSIYNILEVKNKKISCIKSNCPNQVCVSHGFLRSDIDNDMIICAPHKMTIIYK